MQEQNLPAPTSSETNSVPSTEAAPPVNGNEYKPSITTAPERMPAPGDSVNQAGPAPQYSPSNLPQPIQQTAISDQHGLVTSNTSSPAVADDVDVIEKVWVEKAKSIVKQTKDDPYAQEEQVSNLQEDYQQKRYGKS